MKETQEEAARLSEIFSRRARVTQGVFGLENRLGSASMIWQYLHGRRPLSLQAGCRFARGLGVGLAEFSPRLAAELDGIVKDDPAGGRERTVISLPCVELVVQFGTGRVRTIASRRGGAAHFDHDWASSQDLDVEALLAIRAVDAGMWPTFAHDDVVVLSTTDTTLSEGSVFAFNYEGALLLRRVFRDDGAWWLACDNLDDKRFARKRFTESLCWPIGRIVFRQGATI